MASREPEIAITYTGKKVAKCGWCGFSVESESEEEAVAHFRNSHPEHTRDEKGGE
jgi:hypothetical protein